MWEVVVIVLSSAAFILPAVGAGRAWLGGRETLRRARWAVKRHEDLLAKQEEEMALGRHLREHQNVPWVAEETLARWGKRFEAEGLKQPTWTLMSSDVAGYKQTEAIFQQVIERNVVNLALIVLGGACGLAASVVGVFPF